MTDRFAARKSARQSRARGTVEVIVEAASRIVYRDGIARLTTNRVAEIAGVSIGSLYQYFPGKDAVLHALVKREFNRVVDDHVAYIDAIDTTRLSLEETIGRIVDQVLDRHKTHRPLYREILLSVLSVKHLRFTLENDARVMEAVQRKLAAYGIPAEEIDTASFVALHALKGVQIGMAFAARSTDDRQLRATVTRALVACVKPSSVPSAK